MANDTSDTMRFKGSQG